MDFVPLQLTKKYLEKGFTLEEAHDELVIRINNQSIDNKIIQ